MSQAPSVTDVTKALKGMTFPADKEALKKHAQGNDAPKAVISAIENLPEDEFESITDVTSAYGKEDKGEISGDDEGTTSQARKGGSKQSSR
jgi:hypothetical protein